jgi:23S rRNA U2552 (ribose-2'-O)-methylase RlmE/FtsJ
MKSGKSKSVDKKKEFGDWQTPCDLAETICKMLSEKISPAIILEPNCGKGAFLKAAQNTFSKNVRIIGLDINPEHVRHCGLYVNDSLKVIKSDFFSSEWKQYLEDSSGTILIIGNPPWVTKAELSKRESQNFPQNTSVSGLSGIESITGKSNFDISEWMLIEEVKASEAKDALIAMLCKTSTARKVISYIWKNGLSFNNAEIRRIDAKKYFGVAVDACLLTIRFKPGYNDRKKPCDVYDDLKDIKPSCSLGLFKDRIVPGIDVLNAHSELINAGHNHYCFRSGIKHDCAKIMELRALDDGLLINGFNEVVDIEHDLLYPLLKSSDLANNRTEKISRYLLITQNKTGEDTEIISTLYPKTWDYLRSSISYFRKRKSSVYTNKPDFTIFGVGDYSFSLWKVAISGLYKSLNFRVIKPYNGKPVVFDDTCYFLPCENENQANFIKELLLSDIALKILKSQIFWDSKRPITKEILSSLNIGALACYLGFKEVKCARSCDGGSVSLPLYYNSLQHVKKTIDKE